MASKEAAAEENGGCNTETEEETIALQKKRSRRVSFAETTAIHLFTRDDEYETPPDGAAGDSSSDGIGGRLSRSESDEIRELLQSDDDESDGDGDDDVGAVKRSFIRPIESPSPVSNFGSATSNDEDNFFGPVSMDFIKPGRLSDSAASDENHDITMDSTAFSMHFRSLARSDSGGDFKTATGICLAFGDRTPGQISTPNSQGDSMVLTRARKPVSHSSFPSDRVNDSGHSDDMSLVSENPHRYDYGKLPPELDVLLAEDGKDIETVSLNDRVSSLRKDTGSMVNQNEHKLLDVAHNKHTDVSIVKDAKNTSAEAISAADMILKQRIDDVAPVSVTMSESPGNKIANLDDDPVTILPVYGQVKAPLPQTNGGHFDKDEKVMNVLIETSGKFDSPSLRIQSNLNYQQPTGSFVAGSVSSLLAKRRKIFRASENPSNEEWNLIPFSKDVSNEGSIKNVWSTLHFAKGISRLKRLEAFPFASTSKVEGAASRLITSRRCSPASIPKDVLLDCSNDNDLSVNGVDAPVVCLEARFSDVAKDIGESRSRMDNSGFSLVGNKEHGRGTEEVKHVMSSSLTPILPSPERPGRILNAINSPSLTGSQKELDDHMSKDNNTRTTQHLMRSDSSWPEITFNKHSGAIAMSGGPIVSSDNGLEKQVSASSQYQDRFTEQGQSRSRLDRDVAQEEPGVFASGTEDSTSLLSNIKKETDGLSSGFKYQKHGARSVNLSQNEPCALADDVHVYAVGEDVSTPKSNYLTRKNHEDDKHSSKGSYFYGFDSPSNRKRKHRGFTDEAEHHNDEYLSSPNKLQLLNDQNHVVKGREVSCSIGNDTKLRQWTDVFTSFSGTTNQLLSPLIGKHDLALIDNLNDILVHLEKVKSYKHVSPNVCSQERIELAEYIQNKRLMDMKSLLYKAVYKKARLQLLRLKRGKLLDQIQQLNSRLPDSEALMSSFHCSCGHGRKDTQVNSIQPEACLTDIEDSSTASEEISSLRNELDVSDRKINNLTESFRTYFKTVEEVASSNITEYAKEFLKKRVSCQSLLSELQLWEVESLKAKNGQRCFLFNHCGFLSQRFSLNLKRTPAISISKELNNLRISKMLQNMDAHMAFSFVFSGEAIVTSAGLRTIAQETQKTNSALHALLDVVEELELAIMELRNLTHSRFSQPSAGKLDVQLCFSDFKSAVRVNLNIDVTCLNRGEYPSQALPYEVQGRAAGKDESLQMLLTNIRTSLKGLRCGYMRIINLCRCVSKIMQADKQL